MTAPSLCLRKRQPSLPTVPLLKTTVLHQGVYLQLVTSESLLQDYQEHKQAVPGTVATAEDRTRDPGVLQEQLLLAIRSVTDPGNLSTFLLHEKGQSFKMVTNKDN